MNDGANMMGSSRGVVVVCTTCMRYQIATVPPKRASACGGNIPSEP